MLHPLQVEGPCGVSRADSVGGTKVPPWPAVRGALERPSTRLPGLGTACSVAFSWLASKHWESFRGLGLEAGGVRLRPGLGGCPGRGVR